MWRGIGDCDGGVGGSILNIPVVGGCGGFRAEGGAASLGYFRVT